MFDVFHFAAKTVLRSLKLRESMQAIQVLISHSE